MKRTVLFISLSLFGTGLLSAEDGNSLPVLSGKGQAVFSLRAGEAVDIAIPGLRLEADTGSLTHDLTLSVALPERHQTAPMPSVMENVTGDFTEAFRLLPGGVHFSTPARITLSYDPARLPAGTRPEDIRTCFFDSTTLAWTPLERVMLDTAARTVTSLTDHFTDFANAVIRVPDMPETSAFVPTVMQDLPDVNPLQGIPMVAPPTPNNRGTAELTYPIQLPAGRQGMQPVLDLRYSSAGGNGLLGVGWDIPLPAVTIDTRWGVPRYDPALETEAYLVDGEPVLLRDNSGAALPLPHQSGGFHIRHEQDTRFYARDTRNQDVYARHGQTTDTYWWTRTDTEGRTCYYGYDPVTRQIDENSVLRTADGHIGYWALTYMVDRFDNYIRYTNVKYTDQEILLFSIDYTGNLVTELPPTYHVQFYYTSRPDIISDGRLGLLCKNTRRLCQVLLTYMEDSTMHQTAAYKMSYEYSEATLFKSRLTSVIKADVDLVMFECNTSPQVYIDQNDTTWDWIMDEDKIYYDIIPALFPTEKTQGSVTNFTYGDANESAVLFSQQESLIGAQAEISQSETSNWGIGGAVTVGLDNLPCATTLSGGVNYDYSHSTGRVKTMFFDLNGDGLPDQVYVANDTVYYCRQTISGGFESAIRVPGLSCLSRDISSSHSFGAQLDFAANFSYHPSFSNSYTDSYFADINADGLPDFIGPDGIRINRLDNSENPYFTPIANSVELIAAHGNQCGKGIVFDGEVDELLECKIEQRLIDSIPINEILPTYYGTNLFIYTKTEDDHDEFSEILEADHWNPLPIEEQPEGRGDTAIHRSAAEEPSDEPIRKSLFAEYQQDDTTYSRCEPVQSKYKYLLDRYPHDRGYSYRLYHDTIWIYGLEKDCNKENQEPHVDIVRVWVADSSRSIRVNTTIQLQEDTTCSRQQSRRVDGVRYRIEWNNVVSTTNNHLTAHNSTLLTDKFIAPNDYSATSTTDLLDVDAGDILFFRLSARDDRRFDNTSWEQTILTTTGDTLFNSARDYICTDMQEFQAPIDGMARVVLHHQNTDTVLLKMDTGQGGVIELSSMPQVDTTSWFSVSSGTYVHIQLHNFSSAEPDWSKVNVSAVVEFAAAFPRSDGTYTNDTLRYYPSIQIPYSSLYAPGHLYRKLFGPLHKGWGVFADHDVRNDEVIPLDVLVNSLEATAASMNANRSGLVNYNNTSFNLATDTLPGVLSQRFSGLGLLNPLSGSSQWVPMTADARSGLWTAYGNTGYIGRLVHSTSRRISDDIHPTEADLMEYDSPIPARTVPTDRLKYIRKQSFSAQHGVTYGVSAEFVSWGTTVSWGQHEAKSDYLDLNGDGFPDFVGENSVQYSYPWGGIGYLQQLEASYSNSYTSTGANFAASKSFSHRVPGNNIRSDRYMNAGIGGSASGVTGIDRTNTAFIDMNADGLPDIVDVTTAQVRYNIGYSFTDWVTLPLVAVSSASHEDGSAGVNISDMLTQIADPPVVPDNGTDFSLAQYSISGGVSVTGSSNQTEQRLMDMNGDGLPDLVTQSSMGVVSVRYFNGTLFLPQQALNMGCIQNSSTLNVGVNAGVTMGPTFLIGTLSVKLCFGIHTTPWAASYTTCQTDFTDMDGDGYADYISKGDNGLTVRYNANKTTPVNLLTCVTNPTGHKISIQYRRSEPSVNHRGRSWEMSRMDDSILPYGIDDSRKMSYQYNYAHAHYDNHERTDYGYNVVSTQEENTKLLKEEFENEYYLNRGQKISDLLSDMDNHPYIGHRYKYTYYDTQNDPVGKFCDDASLHIGEENGWTDYYEGESQPRITTAYHRFLDAKGRLIRYRDEGDENISGDEWRQEISYKSHVPFNLIHSPKIERLKDGNGLTLHKSRVNYNMLGQPEQIISEDTITSLHAVTTLYYDIYGNVARIIYPHNDSLERAWNRYIYDPVTRSRPKIIYNQFGESKAFSYDLRWGCCTRIQDPAGVEMRYRYDRLGRLVDIIAPKELADNRLFSVHYSYRLPFHQLISGNGFNYPDEGNFYVIRLTADSELQSAEIIIHDARGKVLQTKSRQWLQSDYAWVTDGIRIRDSWNRITECTDPFVSTEPMLEIDANFGAHPFSLAKYDVLDRPIFMGHPDGTGRKFAYGFDNDLYGDLRLKTRIDDEKGVVTEQLYAPQGWLTTMRAGDDSRTGLRYNPLGERTQAEDADGYTTTYQYDMFGHCIKRIHPDAGETRWTYDAAGNLISEQRARHIGAGQQIQYHYYFNRLMDIEYPMFPVNDVHYRYDMAGRRAYWEDGSGSTRVYYDELGNIKTHLRHIVMPYDYNSLHNYAYNFRTETYYDSFGRVQRIRYPDGEDVVYRYFCGGILDIVRTYYGNTLNHIILDSISYDAQGRQTCRRYGNGVVTHYTYSPERNWLTRLQTVTPSSNDTLQDISYLYDAVGNIISIQQNASSVSGLGGSYTNTYKYDSQYRLTDSNGNGNYSYDFYMDYSSAGRVGHRFCGNSGGEIEGSSLYGYDTLGLTHQPRVIFDENRHRRMSLFWDADGNLGQMREYSFNDVRFHQWDDTDRLRMVLGPKEGGFYSYDAEGRRVYKLAGIYSRESVNGNDITSRWVIENAVLYPNPYITITPTHYTKHYFAGAERVATSIGEDPWLYESSMEPILSDSPDFYKSKGLWDWLDFSYYQGSPSYVYTSQNESIEGIVSDSLSHECSPALLNGLWISYSASLSELFHMHHFGTGGIYYNHNDHLGSASWITDATASPVQYLHYLPYGEIYDNQIFGYNERFKFTGKELDEESGYYNFGARLYSSVFGFTKVDPLADKYPDIQPYLYCNGNPLRYIDPDGRDWYEVDGEIKWTDLKSQQAMDQAKLAGKYLGEAVVIFNGYYDETLGEGNNLWGEGAKLATAIVYGPGGCDDIATYEAFTMSSNYNEYGAIQNGEYSLDYVADAGPMGTHWAINNREAVDCVDNTNYAWYKHKETYPYSATQKDKTYVHRCNRNGAMLPLGRDGKYHPLSTGCLIIAPSKEGRLGWNEFNSQLQGIRKAFLRITRQ